MSESFIRNLSVLSPSMGQIVIQPVTNQIEDLEKASLVLFPFRISKDNFNVAVEWASGTQTPIFCHGADIPKLESEGFGAYRFHRLEGYKEIDFQGGAVEFFPARRRRPIGFRGFLHDVSEWVGAVGTPSFHVLVTPNHERPVLYLSSPHIDAVQWDLMTKTNPEIIVGAEQVTRHEWHALSTFVKRKIVPAADLRAIKTIPTERKPTQEAAQGAAWVAKVKSV